jgi:tetratricopeptide (TPR) repeat protein
MNLAVRTAAVIGLVLLSLFFAWFGLCSWSMVEQDLDRLGRLPGSNAYAMPWLFKGNQAMYRQLQTDRAADCFAKALDRQPLLFSAWIGLAKARLAEGDIEGARSLFKVLSPALRSVATWKWHELLLAHALEEAEDFRRIFNVILARSPRRINDACCLAQDMLGGWPAVVDIVQPGNRKAFLQACLAAGQVQTALKAWAALPDTNLDLGLKLCQSLIDQDELNRAATLWSRLRGDAAPGVHNGDFETPFLNRAFGWRAGAIEQVRLERSPLAGLTGDTCLSLRFDGSRNLDFNHFSQIVPLDPNKTYCLDFARKSLDLTTDQGVFIQITGYSCNGLDVASRNLTGTNAWGWERLTFRVPSNCRAVVLRVRRRESLRLDSCISGRYWLDKVRIAPCPGMRAGIPQSWAHRAWTGCNRPD